MGKIKERNEPERRARRNGKDIFKRPPQKKKLLYLVKLFNDIILS